MSHISNKTISLDTNLSLKRMELDLSTNHIQIKSDCYSCNIVEGNVYNIYIYIHITFAVEASTHYFYTLKFTGVIKQLLHSI
jgi:hypothetical protein